MSESINVDDFLEHFGVKGMRWGVRKVHSTSNDSNASLAVRTAQTINRHQTTAVLVGVGVSIQAARSGHNAMPFILGTIGAIALSNATAQKHAEAGKKAVNDMRPST
jgi:hypothetical protein